MLCCLLQMDCKSAIDETPNPIKIGGEQTSMGELRRHHSAIEIEDAKRAWAALNEAITSPSLINKIYAQGSPSEAWAILEEWYAPRGVVMEEEWTTKYDSIRMELGEDPQTYIGRIDDAVDMLESLGLPKTAKEVNRKIIRHLSSDYDIEQRTILLTELSRVAIGSILRERHLKLQSKAGGNGHALFVAGSGRGGPTGGRGGHGSGHHQWHNRGKGRG